MGPGDKVLDESNDAESTQQPDVSSDRAAPSTRDGNDRARRESAGSALTIKEIEQLEDDAPGG